MSTTKLKLTKPTDDQLSAAVAEHVAGWKRIPAHGTWKEMWENAKGSLEIDGPWFAYSADAVLPLLEKHSPWAADSCKFVPNDSRIKVWLREAVHEGVGPTFAAAACIALLRANGIEVEQTAPAQK